MGIIIFLLFAGIVVLFEAIYVASIIYDDTGKPESFGKLIHTISPNSYDSERDYKIPELIRFEERIENMPITYHNFEETLYMYRVMRANINKKRMMPLFKRYAERVKNSELDYESKKAALYIHVHPNLRHLFYR